MHISPEAAAVAAGQPVFAVLAPPAPHAQRKAAPAARGAGGRLSRQVQEEEEGESEALVQKEANSFVEWEPLRLAFRALSNHPASRPSLGCAGLTDFREQHVRTRFPSHV